MSARDFWKFDQGVSRCTECIGTLSIRKGPVQATLGRLLHQFGYRVDEVPASVTVGQGDQGDFVLVDPLSELGHILGDYIGF